MLCLIPLISSEGTKSGKEDLGYILYNSPDSDMIIKGFPLSLDLSNNSPSFQILDFPVHMEVSISNVELGNSGNENSCLINLVCLFVNNCFFVGRSRFVTSNFTLSLSLPDTVQHIPSLTLPDFFPRPSRLKEIQRVLGHRYHNINFLNAFRLFRFLQG